MKTCIHCHEEKPLSEFTMRKRPPIQLYRACKACEKVAYQKPKGSYYSEMNELRERAIRNRTLKPEQDALVYQRVSKGETRKALAAELGVSATVVGRAYKRGAALDKHK